MHKRSSYTPYIDRSMHLQEYYKINNTLFSIMFCRKINFVYLTSLAFMNRS